LIRAGRHFLQIPGPTNVPDRILRAMHRAVMDHRSQEFSRLGAELLENLRPVFQTSGPVIIYPSSATGAWEAAIVNTLSPGDRVLMFETGHFSQQWRQLTERFGVVVDYIPGNWRRGGSAVDLAARLDADGGHAYKAVMAVHNETSTGATTSIADIRRQMDRSNHPALLMVDTVSSLASMDYRHDEWGVDVTVAGSQKGLMLPPGLSFNALSEKALAANKNAKLARSYWDWLEMLGPNRNGFFPFTPATTLLYGLQEALSMLQEEGLANVFHRHYRHAEATRTAVRTWGLEIVCEEPREYSNSVTAVLMPEGHNADRLRSFILENFDMSLGAGLSRLAGKVFRIGHLGSFNDLMLAGTLSGVEMGLGLAQVPHQPGGVTAALQCLTSTCKS
jgi:alanine-glyoxylate transaminase/serine-glyoxylate transaminase/serine-pyruvate transaminase